MELCGPIDALTYLVAAWTGFTITAYTVWIFMRTHAHGRSTLKMQSAARICSINSHTSTPKLCWVSLSPVELPCLCAKGTSRPSVCLMSWLHSTKAIQQHSLTPPSPSSTLPKYVLVSHLLLLHSAAQLSSAHSSSASPCFFFSLLFCLLVWCLFRFLIMCRELFMSGCPITSCSFLY